MNWLLAAVLLAVAGSWAWSHRRGRTRAIDPELLELCATLRKIADSQDYELRVPSSPDAALDQLAESLNHMLERLQRRDEVLRQGNDLLEESIARRTSELEIQIARRREVEDELRAARDEATSAASAKAEFLANMSHEIRTPLIGVIGMAELLQDSVADELQMQYAETLVGSAQHLLTLINDILDYSRIAAGGLQLEETEFDLREICYETAQLLVPNARDRGVEIVVDYDLRAPARVVGDPARIRQQLINLVGNSVKFTENGSVAIVVRVEREEIDEIELSVAVRDTGIGIPREKLELIFDQFTQADASTTRQFGGTGLGLAITRSLCQLMGGSIHVESETGLGTTFKLTIPFRPAEDPGEILHPAADWTDVPALVAMPVGDPADILCDMLRQFGLRPERVGAPGGEELASRLSLQNPSELPPLVFADAGDEPERTISILRGLAAQLGDQSPWFVLMADLVQLGSDQQLQGLVGGSLLRKPVRRADLVRLLDLVARRGEPDVDRDRPRQALLAEDNAVNQRIVAAMLERCGLEVRFASDGREAVDLASRGHFDLILMDCHMPEMDGLRATRAIRALPGEASRTLIVGMLSSDRSVVSDSCVRAGMNEVLSKPITFAKLEALTQRHFPPVLV